MLVEDKSCGMVLCPKCRGDNLHQWEVEVFNRPQEDAPSLAVRIGRSGAPRLGDPDANPSSRRGGLLIYFLCENCHPDFELFDRSQAFVMAIYQHKGNTFIEWKP